VNKSLDALLIGPAAAARSALAELAAACVDCAVTSTRRTADEQYALWCQGRKPIGVVNAARAIAMLAPIGAAENGYTVTNADGRKQSEGGTGRSAHQVGTALDVVPAENGRPVWPEGSDPRWTKIAAAFKRHGFEWGGDWTMAHDGIAPDYPHYQFSESV
jgi:peptidoglycan L-alanyl-D-glutamate endopeptidase CwlK